MMSELWTQIEMWPLSAYIGETWWFPLLESIHVLAVTFLVGSILMADVRLLGLAARNHTVSRITGEIVPWTWGAFAIALVTGLGLFITRASAYVENRAFQIKLLLLLLAGINMVALHFVTLRNVDRWETATVTTAPAKLAGACSVLVWVGVMLAGRWIGHLT